jgi:hypothetical protein
MNWVNPTLNPKVVGSTPTRPTNYSAVEPQNSPRVTTSNQVMAEQVRKFDILYTNYFLIFDLNYKASTLKYSLADIRKKMTTASEMEIF